MQHAEVYRDGSHDPVSNDAGWACVVQYERQRHEQSGLLLGTTILHAELHAAVTGVSFAHLQGALTATLYTDSTSVIGLLPRNPAPTRYAPEIAALLVLAQSLTLTVRCVWVKSHVRGGSSGNARADWLAREVLRDGKECVLRNED